MKSSLDRQLLAEGYAIVRGVYNQDEIQEISSEMDRVRMKSLDYHSTFRHGNTAYVIRPLSDKQNHIRFIHWPAYHYPVAEKYRLHSKQYKLLSCILGEDIKQIVNTFSWKTPKSNDTVFGLHQDSRFRRPRSAFRQLGTSYMQTMLAIDPHTSKSGCLCVFPKSHLNGLLDLPADSSVMDMKFDMGSLEQIGIDPSSMIEVILDPGDVVMWLPDLVHGSKENMSNHYRRAYINGYVVAENCDRGEWAFKGGAPCKLGIPQLTQYEDLYTRPEPHYVSGSLYPYKNEAD